MKFEDLIRKIIPGYESKRELRMRIDRLREIDKSLVHRIRAVERKPAEVTALYTVPREMYKEMCMTGRYSMMKVKIMHELAQMMIDEIAPTLDVRMQPVEREDDTLFEFQAKLLFYPPERSGRDSFCEASNLAGD